MIAILSLLVVVTLSILVTRVATILLMHTGMASQAARFQARSAFSGAGFTTRESEQVVNHPVRRRVVLLLMLLGNAGIVTAVSSLILAFVRTGEGSMGLELKVLLLVVGLWALWVLASSRFVERLLARLIERLLERYTHLEVRDYASLLRLGGDYRIAELAVDRGSWLDGSSLEEARPAAEGVLVLGIASPTGEWFGTPAGDTRLGPEDTLVVYGRSDVIRRLQERRGGREAEREHVEAVGRQHRAAQDERAGHGR